MSSANSLHVALAKYMARILNALVFGFKANILGLFEKEVIL